MASTTALVALSTVTVVGGTWAEDGKLSPKIIVGGAFVAFSLTIMGQASPVLAERFAVLILIIALMRYGVPLAQKVGAIGETKKGKPKGKGKSHHG